MKQIPNIFTLLNLFSGCCAILFAMQSDSINIYQGEDLSTSFSIPEKIYFASICIFIAAVIDFLDGFVARILKATSDLGKQLDSLSDVVSFGVAPSLILYQFLSFSFMQQENGLEVNIIWLLPAFLFACAGAYRLARFNIDPGQSNSFRGVPIPAAGIVVASLPLIVFYNYYDGTINRILFNKWVIYGLIILLSWLMVSNLRLMALKFKDFGFRNNLSKYILAALALVAAFIFHWLAIPIVFVLYLMVSFFTEKSSPVSK